MVMRGPSKVNVQCSISGFWFTAGQFLIILIYIEYMSLAEHTVHPATALMPLNRARQLEIWWLVILVFCITWLAHVRLTL
jgi:hypothetical protein